MQQRRPIPAAGVVCVREGEVLLVRRATRPLAGQWSLPGGKIGWGERARDAALRELREETGVEAEIVGLIDVVDAVFPASGGATSHHVLADYAARWRAGEPVPASDAAEARFFPLEEALSLVAWEETRRIIAAGAETVGARARHDGP
jgi:8-oxo-dGTP diphosphatase